MSTDREALRLQDIIENIDRIDTYAAGMDFDAFSKDLKTVDAVERCLLRISEAVVKIGDERMAEIAPSLPVHAVRGLGNMLRHQYDGLDLRIIFATARESLPQLRVDCVRALSE